jgi:hypothetical protein
LTTERLAIHADNFDPITVGRNAMVWILQVCSSRAKLWKVTNKGSSNNCLMKVRNREPMSGDSGTYPVPGAPKQTVNGSAYSQDVFSEMSRIQALLKEDGLGEFYD